MLQLQSLVFIFHCVSQAGEFLKILANSNSSKPLFSLLLDYWSSSAPYDIAADMEGNLYISDSGHFRSVCLYMGKKCDRGVTMVAGLTAIFLVKQS
jgi:hypothetical protein